MYQIKLTPYATTFYTEWLLEPTGARYNMVMADQVLYGELDIAKLRKALKRYVSEHVLLNSHIQELQGEPYWVKNDSICELEYSECSAKKSELLQYVARPFNLYKGPLYRFKLLRIEKRIYRFIVVLHHIIMDGISIDTGLFEAISNYYNDENYAEPYNISEQVQLLENLESLIANKLEPHKIKYREFWHKQLAEVEPIDLSFLQSKKSLPKKNPSDFMSSVGEIKFNIKGKVAEKIKRIKNKYIITPYMYGQCIFALVLYKYTGHENFAASYPISIKEGTDFIYGAQVNTNLIPYLFSRITRVVDLINYCRDFFKSLKNDGIHYGYYPIGNILQEGNKDLLNVCFIQAHFKDKTFEFSGIEKVECSKSAEFQIDAVNQNVLLLEESLGNKTFNYRIRYDKKSFDKDLLHHFIACYKKLFLEVLEDLILGNNRQISEYGLLDEKQYQLLIYDYNKAPKDYPQNKTLPELFEEQVLKYPNNIAVVYKDIQLTYQNLNIKANQLANHLKHTYDIQPDEMIALCLDRSEYLIIALLAVLKSGAAYVPLSSDYPTDRIHFILEDTKAKVVITHKKYQTQFSGKTFIELDTEHFQNELLKEEAINPKTALTSEHLAYVLYTSGTTGKPKGVLQQHNNVMRLFTATQEQFHFTQQDVWTLFHSYVFDFTVWEIWGALLYGGKLVIPTQEQVKDPHLFYELCARDRVTVLNQTPTAFYQFIEIAIKKFNEKSLSDLRYILLGGEALNFNALRPWCNLYGYNRPKLINLYGLTETTVCATYKEIQKKDVRQGSGIGAALPDQKVYILDKALMPLPLGAVGELYVGGCGLARGYLNRPELTEEKFIPNPFQTTEEKLHNQNSRLYKTGDLVRMLPGGQLEYLGRRDTQVKISGHRIELGEIENTLLSYPKIKQAVVLAKARKDIGDTLNQYLIAYYVADHPLDRSSLQDYVATQLPEYMQPKAFVHLEQLPLTINGKVDVKALPEPHFEHEKYEAPTTEHEQLICTAFAEILGIKKISTSDDFFHLGGDSIQAIRLTAILQNHFNIQVIDVFNLKTPKRLATHLSFHKNLLISKLEKVKLFYKNKPLLSKGSKEKVNRYFEKIKNLNIDYSLRKPISNVLLTGATGFLGCNLLNQLLKRTHYHIYLLVRSGTQEEAFNRINSKYQFYFGEPLSDLEKKRVVVIQSDIEKNNLGLSPEDYKNLSEKIDSIIHSAALVKHYGNYELFYSANVQSTVNLLELCKLTRLKDFHYISTASILNFCSDLEHGEYTYTEEDSPKLFEKQNNVYIETKYQGEQQVIKYRGKGVKSNIYRVGNLALMAKNGRAQENIEENAFFNWLKCLFKIKCIAEAISPIQISQTDLTAEAIVKLFDKNPLSDGIYHVFNPYIFNLKDAMVSQKAHSIKNLSLDQFIDTLIQHLKGNLHRDLIFKFLLQQGWLDDFSIGNETTEILQDKTQHILKQLGFEWLPITNTLFNKITKSCF